MGVIIHALYADDFLHFTNNKVLYQDFQKQFKKHFDVKTESVGFYLGTQISVDHAKLTVHLNQTEYVTVQELVNLVCSTLSPRTVAWQIVQMFCGGSLTRIGLALVCPGTSLRRSTLGYALMLNGAAESGVEI